MAWLLCGLTLVCLAATVALDTLNGSSNGKAIQNDLPVVVELGYLVLFIAFPVVGALIVRRQRTNAVGWIFCAVGLALSSGVWAESYTTYAYFVNPGALPGAAYTAWLTTWFVGGTSMFGLLVWLLLLFPTGRPPAPRWRWVAWITALSMLFTFAGTFKPGPFDNLVLPPGAVNPLGIPGARAALVIADVIGFVLAVVAAGASAVALVGRLRRSRGTERQQLKWFTFSAVIVAFTFLTAPIYWLSRIPGVLWGVMFLVAMGTLPAAVGIAILKHNLYDIDLIIRRTLVYAGLTLLLGAGYVAGVVLLQTTLDPVTRGSNVAVAATTLAAAAAFRPARGRMQSAVDRRFNRHRYDAARTIEVFAARLREEVDLDALVGELRGVVQETMQPSHVSLWLRQAERAGGEQGP